MRSIHALPLLLALAGSACTNQTSSSRDIATDLDGNGTTYYFYVEDGFVVRGTCEPGQPSLKAFCQTDLTKVGLNEFKERFTLSLQEQAQLASQEIAPLEATFAEQDEIYAASKASAVTLTTELDALKAELATIVTASSENDATIKAFDDEIARVDAKLATSPTNEDLLAAKAALLDERAPYVAKKAELTAQMDSYQNATTGSATLKQGELTAMIAARDAALAARNVAETKLRESRKIQLKLIVTLDKVDATLTKLGEGVRYAVMEDNGQLEDLREIVAFFNKAIAGKIFAGTPSAPVTPIDPNVRLSAAGLLEVQFSGSWRGVCDDNFDAFDGAAACKSLGKTFVSFTGAQASNVGFWLDGINCNGNEASILQCAHLGVGNHDCSAGEHVALVCQ